MYQAILTNKMPLSSFDLVIILEAVAVFKVTVAIAVAIPIVTVASSCSHELSHS